MTASRMWSARRTIPLASLAALAALVVVATLLTPGSARGQSASTSTLPDGGDLHLHFGPDGNFFRHALGATNVYEHIGSSGCQAVIPPSPPPAADVDLVNVVAVSGAGSASAQKVGLATSGSTLVGLGARPTRGSGANGTGCGYVEAPSEYLEISLGGYLDGKLATSADLDIDAKYNVIVQADLFVGNTLTDTKMFPTNTGSSDSNPDCAGCNNFRFLITGTFDRIRLTALPDPAGTSNAAFSLAGGRESRASTDPLEAFDTVFHLVEADGSLDCGQTVTQGGTGTPASSLERLPNASGDCSPIPYNLDSSTSAVICDDSTDPQCVLLQKDLLGQAAQFYWTVTWVPEPGEYQETETQFDFGDGFQALQQCLGDDDGDGFPELPLTTDETDPPDATDPWCVVSTSAELDVNTGLTTVIETYFGRGDPAGRR